MQKLSTIHEPLFYDPEYDRLVNEGVIRKQYDAFGSYDWFSKTYDDFKKDNFFDANEGYYRRNDSIPACYRFGERLFKVALAEDANCFEIYENVIRATENPRPSRRPSSVDPSPVGYIELDYAQYVATNEGADIRNSALDTFLLRESDTYEAPTHRDRDEWDDLWDDRARSVGAVRF